jgi:hypothetical protein
MCAQHEQWLCSELRSLLGIPEVLEIARQMISLSSRSIQMAQTYAEEILGTDDPQTIAFLERFSSRMQGNALANSKLVSKVSDLSTSKGRALTVKYESKKNSKAVVSKRIECGCYGLDHQSLVICTICGRIHCEIEGEGDCFFCKSKVFRSGTIANQEFVDMMKSKANCELKGVEVSSVKDELDLILAQGLERAIAQKNKLIEFSQDAGVKRIIDDQEDFYDIDEVDANVWLDDDERAEFEEKAFENEERLMNVTKTYRAPVKVTLDIHNKEIIQEEDVHKVEAKLKEVKIAPFELPKADQGKIMRGCTTLDAEAKQVYEELRAKAAERLKAKLVKAPKKKNPIKVIASSSRIQDDVRF